MSRWNRYRKQMLVAGIGETGQQAIRDTRVLLVGCGALGTAIAEGLTRAGIGRLRIADRDFVELSNLQRQVLFDEDDVRTHLPKAVAAATKLQRINSEVALEPVVTDVHAGNVLSLLAGCTLIMDGTDNFETRYLLNDASLETGIPWVSGGVLGTSGQVFLVVPGITACLRCLLPDQPPQTETCETAGVLGPAVSVIAGLQVARALQFLTDSTPAPNSYMTVCDVWSGRFQQIDLAPLHAEQKCPACAHGERLWLRGERSQQTHILCGRNSVQVGPARPQKLNLAEIALRWESLGQVRQNPFLLGLQPHDQPEQELHLFADGRAIVQGTEDPGVARSLYARYVGN